MIIPTLDILSALKARIAQIELEPGALAFQEVEFYPRPNLVKALQDLRLFKNRVCLIVPDGEDFENEVSGRNLITRSVKQVILLIADRDFARRQDAVTGDDTTPGVIRLSELVIVALTGQSLGLPGCRIRPELSEPVLLSDKEQGKTTGREAWHLDLSIEAGVMKTTINY